HRRSSRRALPLRRTTRTRSSLRSTRSRVHSNRRGTVPVPDEEPSGPTVATPPTRVIVPLGEAECRAVLERQRLCVGSVADGGEPYAVPVFYGFDGATLYLGTSEGRKTRALDANSRVYVLVTEVGPGDAWRSVAIAGRARTLTTETERQRAI